MLIYKAVHHLLVYIVYPNCYENATVFLISLEIVVAKIALTVLSGIFASGMSAPTETGIIVLHSLEKNPACLAAFSFKCGKCYGKKRASI